MKTKSLLVVLVLLIGAASLAVAQVPAIAHNTWTSGAPMPTAMAGMAVGVLKGQIYVVGGTDTQSATFADTEIYNPVTNTWSTGVSLPTPNCCGTAAVVKNVLYVIGGGVWGGPQPSNTNAVWAYNSKTKTWTSKSPMPTARSSIGAVVQDGIIYVIGGNGNYYDYRLNTVESYNPATDTWTEEAPLLVGKSEPSVAMVGNKLLGFTILAADGYALYGDTGDNEGYDADTNTWTTLAPDPVARNGTCAGGIGAQMYVAGGYISIPGQPPLTLTESFKVSKNAWKTLAPMPLAEVFGDSAVYKGRLYCFGGLDSQYVPINNVQIYQP